MPAVLWAQCSKALLCTECVPGAERLLVTGEDDGAAMIDCQSTADVLELVLLLAFCVGQAAKDAGFILI